MSPARNRGNLARLYFGFSQHPMQGARFLPRPEGRGIQAQYLMKTNTFVSPASALLALTWIIGSIASGETAGPAPGPHYAADRLMLPEHYREWVYLSTGFDMSYSALAMPGHHMFD